MSRNRSNHERGTDETRVTPDRFGTPEETRPGDSQAPEELAPFFRLAIRLGAAASPEAVMQIVWEETVEVFDWDCCYLVYEKSGGEMLRTVFYVDTEDGKKKAYPGEERRRTDFSPTVQRVLDGEALLINRTPGSPEPVMVPYGTGRISASLVFAPVRFAGAVVGALTVQSYTPGRYGQRDLEVLRRIADVVAPAVHRIYAEDRLKESEQRYGALMEQVPVLTYSSVADGTGVVTHVSQQMEVLLGYPAAELQSGPDIWQKTLHPGDRALLQAEWVRRRSDGTPATAEYRMISRDGRVLWVRDTAVPVRDSSGQIVGFQGIMIEIGAGKRTEELLRTQRDLGIALGETATLADALGCVLSAALHVEGIECGGVYMVNEATGDLDLIVHRGLSQQFVDSVSHVGAESSRAALVRRASPSYSALEMSIPELDGCRWEGIRSLGVIPVVHEGRVVAVLNVASRTLDEIPVTGREAIEAIAAQVGGAIVQARLREALEEAQSDLERRVEDRTTELRAVNERLTEEIRQRERAEARLELVSSAAEQSIDGLAVVNLGGNVVFVNEAFARMHGYTPAELIGKPLSIFHTAEQMAAVEAANRRLRETGLFQGEIWHVRRDGTVFPTLMHNSLLRDSSRKIIGMIGTAHDITDAKAAERKLQESEAKYRAVVQDQTELICRFGEHGILSFVNDALCQLVECRPEDLIGRVFYDFLCAEDSASVRAQLASLDSAHSVGLNENRAFLPNGEMRWLQWTNRALFNTQGELIEYQAVGRDVTDRKRAEEALRQSEERFRVVTEHSLLGVCVYQAGRLSYANPAFATIFGYAPQEIVNRASPLALIHPEDRDMVAENLRRRMDGEIESAQYRFRGLRKDGSVVHCEAYGRFMKIQGQPSIIGIIVDITDRVNAESQQERLIQAIENAGEGIAIWDGHWHLMYLNGAMGRIFGLPCGEDPTGWPWSALFEGRTPRVHASMDRILAEEGTWSGRLSAKRPDGARTPLAVTFTRFAAVTGHPMIVGSIRDISREESYLAQIRKLTADSEKRLEEEKARISRELHDELGQLLTALNLDLAWVGRRLDGAGDTIRERVTQMKDITNRATERVRDLSRSLHPPVLDHEGLAATVITYAAEFERRSGVKCQVAVQPHLLKVKGASAVTAFRIVQEALTNVARHAHASRCDVSLELRRGRLEVMIRDNGIGTTPELLQGRKSLGVLAMQERAAAAGGTLSIESEPQGGVCVKASLPTRGSRRPRRP